MLRAFGLRQLQKWTSLHDCQVTRMHHLSCLPGSGQPVKQKDGRVKDQEEEEAQEEEPANRRWKTRRW